MTTPNIGRAFFCALLGLATGASAHRVAHGDYVTVNELREQFDLGRTTLEAEVNHADIRLDGVRHWLNTPVIAARGCLWISATDVEQTIRPVVQSHGGPVRVIVIDPGHGGSDSGTRGAHSQEKEMTLDLAKRVEHDLSAVGGLRVLLTRTGDVTTPLEQRMEFCRAEHADLYVSLHFNAGGTADGIETYCVPPAGASPTAHAASEGETEAASANAAVTNNRFDKQNIWLAHCVQKSLLQTTHANDRGVRRARFYVLRHASCPAILVEGGFLSNAGEEQKILRADYREKLAQAVTAGILAYENHNHGDSHG